MIERSNVVKGDPYCTHVEGNKKRMVSWLSLKTKVVIKTTELTKSKATGSIEVEMLLIGWEARHLSTSRFTERG
jgi:hypothetical protein